MARLSLKRLSFDEISREFVVFINSELTLYNIVRQLQSDMDGLMKNSDLFSVERTITIYDGGLSEEANNQHEEEKEEEGRSGSGKKKKCTCIVIVCDTK